VKMTPMWFWVQAITFVCIVAAGIIAVTKLA
jgi:hypothetical protein